MTRVVYLLGAGFSAPLGLPCISDFLFRSKDQYVSDPDSYPHFKSIFDSIAYLSRAKNYLSLDLFNIEEIFSILDMQSEAVNGSLRPIMEAFLKDVIRYHTPKNVQASKTVSHSEGIVALFGSSRWPLYVAFVAGLCGVEAVQHGEHEKMRLDYQNLLLRLPKNSSVAYKIITLNYDLIVEQALEFLGTHFQFDKSGPAIEIAKLHGSVDGDLVPPTWRKFVNESIKQAWIRAHQWISEATHIRIIGYSLPQSDNHMRYLLASGLCRNENLKQLDIICRDTSGSVRRRFSELVEFPRYRFGDLDIRDYLESFAGVGGGSPLYKTAFEAEYKHENFMRRAASS